MDSHSHSLFSPVSPLSPDPPRYTSSPSPREGAQPRSTPVHEGLQVVEPIDPPPPSLYSSHPSLYSSPPSLYNSPSSPYSYQGQIQPDVVPLSVLGDRYGDDHLVPCYPERRIWGLAVRTFWIAVGVAILLVVIGVAVGAGVGGSQAAKHSKEAKEAAAASSISVASTITSSPMASAATGSSSASVASTVTSSPITSVATGSSSAASRTGSPTSASSSPSSTASSTSSGISFATPVPISGILPFDCPNIDGSTYSTSTSRKESSFKITCGSNIDGNDVDQTFAPSLKVCIEDCAAFTPKGSCIAVVFNANLTLSTAVDGNCFFKSSTKLHAGSYKLQACAILQ